MWYVGLLDDATKREMAADLETALTTLETKFRRDTADAMKSAIHDIYNKDKVLADIPIATWGLLHIIQPIFSSSALLYIIQPIYPIPDPSTTNYTQPTMSLAQEDPVMVQRNNAALNLHESIGRSSSDIFQSRTAS